MMWQPKLFVLVLAASTLYGSIAFSEDAETTADLRCMVAITIASASLKDQPEKLAFLSVGLSYFHGRVDGRDPNLNLENRLIVTMREMKRSEVGPTLVKCSAELKTSGQVLEDIGHKLLQQLDEQKRL